MTFDALFPFSIFSDDLFRAFTVQTISKFFRCFSFGRRLEKLIIFRFFFSKTVFFKIFIFFKKKDYIYIIINFKCLKFLKFLKLIIIFKICKSTTKKYSF